MVHIDLQCTMEPTQTAAYDPIFWLHHSFIDKVWADRQNNPDLPQMTNEELKDTILEPFGSTLGSFGHPLFKKAPGYFPVSPFLEV